MNPRTFHRALLALAALGAASCSFMVDYDLEGKPCGNNKTCRPGYVCTEYYGCMLADEDAGPPVKRDGGLRDGGGSADAGGPGDAEEPDADLEAPDV